MCGVVLDVSMRPAHRCRNQGETITLRREREGGIAYVYCAYHARTLGVYLQGDFPIVPCPRTKGVGTPEATP